jgi:hypothetical protein
VGNGDEVSIAPFDTAVELPRHAIGATAIRETITVVARWDSGAIGSRLPQRGGEGTDKVPFRRGLDAVLAFG